jgi:hypothetical protein
MPCIRRCLHGVFWSMDHRAWERVVLSTDDTILLFHQVGQVNQWSQANSWAWCVGLVSVLGTRGCPGAIPTLAGTLFHNDPVLLSCLLLSCSVLVGKGGYPSLQWLHPVHSHVHQIQFYFPVSF